MARIETLRIVPAPSRVDVDGAVGGSNGRSPELLDVLASGHPPAFATDSRERVVFWNEGAATLLGRRAGDAIGRHCYEVFCGRDVWGNRFCSAACPVAAMARQQEPVSAFDVRTAKTCNGSAQPATVNVTIIRLPGPRSDLFTLVHLLQEVDEESRVSRALQARGEGSEENPTPVPVVGPSTVAPSVLTPREREILQWMAAGLQNKEIAEKLELSLATVRNHVHNTLEKLGVHSKLEAVSMAFRNRWVNDSAAGGR